ncbi:hypothetical protein GEMRC1_005960 [Eukaryota sp. GEM-RC1]
MEVVSSLVIHDRSSQTLFCKLLQLLPTFSDNVVFSFSSSFAIYCLEIGSFSVLGQFFFEPLFGTYSSQVHTPPIYLDILNIRDVASFLNPSLIKNTNSITLHLDSSFHLSITVDLHGFKVRRSYVVGTNPRDDFPPLDTSCVVHNILLRADSMVNLAKYLPKVEMTYFILGDTSIQSNSSHLRTKLTREFSQADDHVTTSCHVVLSLENEIEQVSLDSRNAIVIGLQKSWLLRVLKLFNQMSSANLSILLDTGGTRAKFSGTSHLNTIHFDLFSQSDVPGVTSEPIEVISLTDPIESPSSVSSSIGNRNSSVQVPLLATPASQSEFLRTPPPIAGSACSIPDSFSPTPKRTRIEF